VVNTSFCIDLTVLGTEKHLLCKESGFVWLSTVPQNTWHLSGNIKQESDWCLDTVLRLAGKTIEISPPEKFVNSMKKFTEESDVLPWQHLMPQSAHRAFMKNLVNSVVVAIDNIPMSYYRSCWVPGNGVIRSLKQATIDNVKWRAIIDACVPTMGTVKTFRPDQYGLAEKIVYDRFGALTGRLTVTDGPNIMTLKKEYRDIIVPSTINGCIMCIDFAALEARVLLYEAGKRCEDPDLYGMIARELGKGVSRKAAKAAVISELYGSSKTALGKVLGLSGKELNVFVKQVKTYFNTAELLKRVKKQFVETGKIVNRYGRHVVIDEPLDHIMINYYAQSTGADVALLGFSKIVNELSLRASNVKPLFLLHDGLFLDVPEEHIETILKIDSVNIDGYVQKFILKVEKLNCTQVT